MTLNIGWIGCGRHATDMLLPQLVRYDVQLAAICDTDPARLAEVERQYGVGHAYADYRDLLGHPGLDAIGMAVGPAAHLEIGTAAAARELVPGKLLLHVSLVFQGGAIGTLVMGTIQSRGTPMEFVQVMGDHRRVEVENVINVACYRDPPFKAADPAATLREQSDTRCWRPNFTAAANEDFKGSHALLADALAAFRGEPNAAPTIADGVEAMAWLDRLRSVVHPA